jgi:hypothetical protein
MHMEAHVLRKITFLRGIIMQAGLNQCSHSCHLHWNMHHSKKKLISVGGGDGAAAAGSALARATTIGSNGAGTSITTPYLWGVDEEMLLPAS